MRAKITKGCKYWGQLLLLPIYWLSFLMPRDKKLWLFGSTFGRRFADNPRYLYLYVSQHRNGAHENDAYESGVDENGARENGAHSACGHEDPDAACCRGIRPVWISHDKQLVAFLQENGYKACYYHSLKGIWLALRGGVYLFDNYSKDINFWQSGGAVKVNLWHGVPLKKIQHDNIHDAYRNPKNNWERFRCMPRNLSDEKPSHYVLCPSARMRSIFASAFQTKRVIVNGYPRNDVFRPDAKAPAHLQLPRESDCLERIAAFRRQHPEGKVVCYMPTFRQSETKLANVMDWNRLETFLKQNEMYLIVKLHPKSTIKNTLRASAQGCLYQYPPELDSNVLLAQADILVTDYSSTYFDFLQTNRPIVFFCYDYEEYISESRELYFDYAKVTPGQKAANQDELEQALLREAAGGDEYCEGRDTLRKQLYSSLQEPYARHLVEKLREIVEG